MSKKKGEGLKSFNKGFSVPDTYIIIFFVVVLAAIVTFFVPKGYYETQDVTYMMNGVEKTRTGIKDGSFQYLTDDEGKPVTELGPYAFSDHIDQKDLEKAIETGRFCREDGETADGTDENLSVSGEKVSEVFLPETLKKIGRYAFYNCRKLKKIALGGTCMDVGAGAFTGCHQVEEIRITVQSDGTSALREILTELPETIRVDWKKEGLKGVFWFPEFFEEGVENTPARILENHIHGSGLRYRNCFARNSLNIREYDELFPYAKAWEEEGVVLKMALGRLLFPVELGEKAEEHYLSHIREHLVEAARILTKEKDYRSLGALLERVKPDREALEQLLSMAQEQKDMEAVSLFMDRLHQNTKIKRKVFEL